MDRAKRQTRRPAALPPVGLLLMSLLLASLAACGEEPPGNSASSGGGDTPGPPASGSLEPIRDPEELTVADAISEEGTWAEDEAIPFRYSYHVPEIRRDAPGAEEINAELRQLYAGLVQESRDTDELPECDTISYEHYRNGDVLSLVVTCSFGMTRMMDYRVYHYDIRQDRALTQEELPALLDTSAEELHSAFVRAAAQAFDEAYHGMDHWDTPSAFYQYRAVTLGGYYLDNALVYLGEDAQPRVLLPIWSYVGAGVAFRDLPLELSPGEDGTLEDSLLDVSWDNTRVTLRFHGDEDSRAFWEERFQCGWDLEYDTDLPVAGLYSRYTGAVLHMARANDPPILFLLTDQGRVEYVDLVACMRGGYFCGGGPLAGVENAAGFTGPDETGPGRGGAYAYAACQDGSKVDLAQALAEDHTSLPQTLAGVWEVAVTCLLDDGGSYEDFYSLRIGTDGTAELECRVLGVGLNLHYSGAFTPLGATEDGLVCCYDLEPGGDGYDGIPFKGVLALRLGYDQNIWEEVLDTTTLGMSSMSLFGDTPGTVRRLTRAEDAGASQVSVDFAPEGVECEKIILDSGAYTARLLFTADGPVRDFTVLRLNAEVFGEDGRIEFSTEPAAAGELSPTNPVAVQLAFLGTIPNYGISYVDSSGTLRRFALFESGYDGSILLEEADPSAEGFVLGG